MAKPGRLGPPQHITLDDLTTLLANAQEAKAAGISVPIPGEYLVRLISQMIRTERDYGEIRAACRREIMAFKTAHLHEINSLRKD